ncbi:tetratricopeptide repeat protein [Nocardiopsis sp. N85]|nr:tetratricopeptide repeat protein [Nocardiopsis sp. N85]MDE3721223.1 tetratricopeptide repeat protein [Nocardiopsis sp. N85]
MANYESVISYAEETEDPWLIGFSLRGLGLIHLEMGDLDRARDHFHSSREVFRANGVRRGEGMALLSLGEHARLIGDFDAAVSMGSDAVQVFIEIDDAWSEAWGALPLAKSLAELSRGREAAELLVRASRTFDGFKDRRSLAMSSDLLGDVHHQLGETATAADHWLYAAEIYESLGEDTLGEESRTKARRFE